MMVGELLTWLGVVSVLLLAWTIYVTAPHDDDEERAERVSDVDLYRRSDTGQRVSAIGLAPK
jgi:hypothetical protein